MAENASTSEEREKALADFHSGQVKTITPPLQNVLEEVAATGVNRYPWPQLRSVLRQQLSEALDKVHAGDKRAPTSGVGWGSPTSGRKSHLDEQRDRLLGLLDAYEAPPFTLQRLAELALNPEKLYKSLTKYINALEKLLSVSSTLPEIDPRVAAKPVPEEEPPSSPPMSAETSIPAPSLEPLNGNLTLDATARAPWANGDNAS